MNSKGLQKIIYAEDEEDIRAIAQIALEDIGSFTVKYCLNGHEVLEAVKDFQPDLFLLDVMMPTMDGPSALRKLKQIPQMANVPAIFMTAKIQPKEVEEYKSIGAIDVIHKPFDPITLADDIKKIWNKFYDE
ncbi:response regulator [Legionella brunensis]|uniref:Two-component response regulator n=1 Tax=Legionella brunensis TaxID=29422 RepID=A0A0W0SNK6_9GAMM|nr:response regulator [Legionella brunensis]KTC84966.1 two-component response regulator [Legionella brunensis]